MQQIIPHQRAKKTARYGTAFQVLETEDLYGFSADVDNNIHINIELLWKHSGKNEDKFIKTFAQTYAHELLHVTILDNLLDLFSCNEERFIRRMMGEAWTKSLSKYYTCKSYIQQ